MSDPILNLAAWIDCRRKNVGPYADHIIHSVQAYEARITALEAENARLLVVNDLLGKQLVTAWDQLKDKENERMQAGLQRIATPLAFYVATSNVEPEVFARMIYAEKVLGGMNLKQAEKETEAETKDRYPLRTPEV